MEKREWMKVVDAKHAFIKTEARNYGEYTENVAYCVVISAPEKNFFMHCKGHDCRECKLLIHSALKKLGGK